MPRVRVHQHVNPLAPYFRFTPQPLNFNEIFTDSGLPLHLDIGSARGRFLLQMAELDRQRNYLGVEIREPLVIEASQLAREANLTNLHYEFCNATMWLDRLLSKLTENVLETVTIQFPDPWYKKKHAKRRMVKDEMIEAIAKHLIPAGKVFVQTDVEFLAEEMFDLFRAAERFQEIKISENPFPVKTEREISVETRNLPVYRTIFEKIK